jgi:hypothetical protein
VPGNYAVSLRLSGFTIQKKPHARSYGIAAAHGFNLRGSDTSLQGTTAGLFTPLIGSLLTSRVMPLSNPECERPSGQLSGPRPACAAR